MNTIKNALMFTRSVLLGSAIAITILLPLTANAERFYIGVSLSDVNYSRDNVQRAILDELNGFSVATVFAEDGGERPPRIVDLDESLNSFTLKLGYQLNDYFSVEVRGAFGVSEATLDDYAEDQRAQFGTIPGLGNVLSTFTTPKDSTLTLNSTYGAFLRAGGGASGKISIGPISPYLLVGYQRSKFTAGIDGGTAGVSANGNAYGAGMNIRFWKDYPTVFNVEWVEQTEESLDSLSQELDLRWISAGFEYRF